MSNGDDNLYDIRAAMEAVQTRPWPRTTRRQRGQVPSDSLVPIQFRMPPDFVQEFKQEALSRGLKLNDLLALSFNELRRITKITKS
jgi:hypothetical protein